MEIFVRNQKLCQMCGFCKNHISCPAQTQFNPNSCIGCKACFLGCPHNAIQKQTIANQKAIEVFVDEITNLVKKAEEAGVDVLYHLYPEMPHVHQSLDLSIPEVQTSIQNIGQYVRKHFNLL